MQDYKKSERRRLINEEERLQWFGLGSLSLSHNLERSTSKLGHIAASREFSLGYKVTHKGPRKEAEKKTKGSRGEDQRTLRRSTCLGLLKYRDQSSLGQTEKCGVVQKGRNEERLRSAVKASDKVLGRILVSRVFVMVLVFVN